MPLFYKDNHYLCWLVIRIGVWFVDPSFKTACQMGSGFLIRRDLHVAIISKYTNIQKIYKRALHVCAFNPKYASALMTRVKLF